MPPRKPSKRAKEATRSTRSQKNSAWTIKFLDVALDQLEALPKAKREHILNFIFLKLRRFPNPRRSGKPLEAEFAGFWRYRIDDYRIICTIDDAQSLIRIARIGHRYDVYRPG